MSRKHKEQPILEQIEITDVAAEGKALVRVNDLVVFVPWVVPGDIVDLKILKKKHHYAEAEVVLFHKYSEKRIDAFCPHFGVCGGCKWQMLPYKEQLRWKQKQVVDTLERIGKIEIPECRSILGSKKTIEYRNKVEFGCARKVWLTREQISSGVNIDVQGAVGFHAGGAFDKILPVEECHLMHDENNLLRNDIRDYAFAHGLSFHDPREHKGLLRGMMIRLGNAPDGKPTNKVPYSTMLLLQFCITTSEEQQQANALMQYLCDRHPELTSLLWVNNTKFNDTFGDLAVHTFHGSDHIFLYMEGLRFKVGPKSFYQTNTEQAYELYKVTRELAFGNEEHQNPLVYDLYTGTGTIANFVAHKAKQVVGIEYVPEAIADARVNSQLNNIDNTLFYAGDMKDILSADFIHQHGSPDIIITDPPRAGMHPEVIKSILDAAPRRIVYVSCNPATQARDIQLLNADYRVAVVQPVDMFPHTQHVENVALLLRR